MGYMSPEQADSGRGHRHTNGVYSLGVVLFELLVGALPLDLNKMPCDETLRRWREHDTPKPSAKLRSIGAESTTARKSAQFDPQTLTRLLSGDLDAIVLKALEKNRSLRYATPSELAADIGRFLRNEPVTVPCRLSHSQVCSPPPNRRCGGSSSRGIARLFRHCSDL